MGRIIAAETGGHGHDVSQPDGNLLRRRKGLDNSGWRVVVGGVRRCQLAVEIVSPTVGAAAGSNHAGVRLAGSHLERVRQADYDVWSISILVGGIAELSEQIFTPAPR